MTNLGCMSLKDENVHVEIAIWDGPMRKPHSIRLGGLTVLYRSGINLKFFNSKRSNMLSWSIFFLVNAVFAALLGFSGIESPYAGVARNAANILFATFILILWMERYKRKRDV
jgi:uncharacterized membrane protein YtjA (UPF0391 family)